MVSTANHYPIIPFDQRGRKPQHPSVPKSSAFPQNKSSNLPNPFLPSSDLSQNKKAKKQQKTTKNKTELDIHEQAPIPFLIPFRQVKKKTKRKSLKRPQTKSKILSPTKTNLAQPPPPWIASFRLLRLTILRPWASPPPPWPSPSSSRTRTSCKAYFYLPKWRLQREPTLADRQTSTAENTGLWSEQQLSLFSSTFCYVVEGECNSQYIDFGSRFSWKLQPSYKSSLAFLSRVYIFIAMALLAWNWLSLPFISNLW